MIDFESIIKKGKHISGDAYGMFWEKYDKEGIRARKLEFLQTYAFIDGDENFNNGNYKKFLETLKEFHTNAWGGKNNIKRMHYIEYPLNSYLEMEYYAYLINETYGQEIRVTSNRKLFPQKTYDFVMFENGNLFLLDFGNNDAWNGAWHVTDKKALKEIAVWYDNIFEKSASFKTMLKPKKEIVDGMKSLGII